MGQGAERRAGLREHNQGISRSSSCCVPCGVWTVDQTTVVVMFVSLSRYLRGWKREVKEVLQKINGKGSNKLGIPRMSYMVAFETDMLF